MHRDASSVMRPDSDEESPLTHGLVDTGLREIVSFEQKRYVADSGQCISEYIAQIEGRTVVALSVLSAGLCRDNDLRRSRPARP